jgi:hypothetical protein
MYKILFISELSQMWTQRQTWRLTLIELVTELITILQKLIKDIHYSKQSAGLGAYATESGS